MLCVLASACVVLSLSLSFSHPSVLRMKLDVLFLFSSSSDLPPVASSAQNSVSLVVA